jgi:homogentisate phytyltransferase/homogentisate geranylgeranyltransferase
MLAGNRPEQVFVAGSILYTDTQKFAAIYALLFSALSFLFLFVVNRRNLGAIVRTVRLERLIFYGAMAIFGFILAIHQLGMGFDGHEFSYLALIMIFLSLCFGFWGLQVVNDFYDVDIDRVVSKENPLLRGVGQEYYKIFGCILLFIALAYAFTINFPAFLILNSYLLLGIIYSMPPVRLKRVPLISTFTLALAVMLSIAFGFSVYYGNRAVNAIPLRLLAPTLIAITLGFTAKDINDISGDRKHGVMTIPVLLYDRNALTGRLPVAAIISCCFLVYIAFIPEIIPGALACATGTLLYTLLQRDPKEWFYFLVLYIFGGYLLYTLLNLPPL